MTFSSCERERIEEYNIYLKNTWKKETLYPQTYDVSINKNFNSIVHYVRSVSKVEFNYRLRHCTCQGEDEHA